MDDFFAQFLNSFTTREAQSWLEESTVEDFRSLSEHETTEESLALVKELYAAGATTVLAVEINEYEWGQNSGRLVIELPMDSSSRAAVLQIVNDIGRSQGFDPEHDIGQSHVFAMLD